MKKYLFVLLLSGCFYSSFAQDNTAYKKPPALIEKLLLSTFNPGVSFNNEGTWMVELQRSAGPTVEDLAQPELRIAGLRMNPANFSPSRGTYFTGLTLKDVTTRKSIAVSGLPDPVKASAVSWNKSGNKLAFLQENRNAVDLYIVDVKTAKAVKVNKTPLNIATGNEYAWYDDETLLYHAATASPDAAPKKPAAPSGPVVQQNLGKVAASRTYQDLIKNKYDEDLFRFFARSQIVRNKNGVETPVGVPGMYASTSLSPDGNYLLVERLTGELSYLVPFYGFASVEEVWAIDGHLVKEIAKIPSSEGAPSGFDNVLNAPRGFSWIATKPATVGWIVPLDSGFIKKQVPDHDQYLTLDAPFTTAPQPVVATPMRMYSVSFVNEELALVTQGSFAKQRHIWQLLDLKTKALKTLSDRSSNDEYSNPGTPFMIRNGYGRMVPLIYQKTKFIMDAQGASLKGDYPAISTLDFTTGKQEKLWQCQDPYYEVPIKLLSWSKGIRFVTSRQSNTEAPNYFITSTVDKKQVALTDFPDPQPELRELRKEKISYTRKDGVQLTANLYVSKKYNPAMDGRLPVIIVAYPREYKQASDAAQVRGSRNTFTQINYGSFVFFALEGYAVMDNTEFPIVGEGSNYPNDNFVEQLEWNAKAAIDKIAAMGIGDSTRVAVAGHSYGAFMTANLLAHTHLFKAGIARSGAYNRTLTPFGFQNEERTYWQAPQVYSRMSPFSYADKIKTPLLLIHGEADNNPGTFPIQSERLFNAIKGHGGTVRFVQLPFEAHGYAAKENLLHLLWEENQWLERYVKNAK
ncbi:MAG: S9 family peptidase [Niabella sp.]|nr:S9 family peptidase [Niabella sp.]